MRTLSASPLRLGHGTHPGETGKNNEDNYTTAAFQNAAGETVTLLMVADGIGGHRAGEVASALAVENVVAQLKQSEGTDFRQLIEQAIQRAAQAVSARSQTKRELTGMGTTCVVALIAGRRLYAGYIGDSRLYLLQGGTLRQVSVDHTWIQQALEHGLLTPAEAKLSFQRHVVLKHIGKDPQVEPDFRLRLAPGETAEQSEAHQGLQLEAGEGVVLCSDGLSDLVEAEEILALLTSQTPQAAVDALITLARQRGGHDNITVIAGIVP